jgi:hypothetical protein
LAAALIGHRAFNMSPLLTADNHCPDFEWHLSHSGRQTLLAISQKLKLRCREKAMPKSRKSNGSDAIAMLKSDHRKVEDLFKRYEKSKSDAPRRCWHKRSVLNYLCNTSIEEELFASILQLRAAWTRTSTMRPTSNTMAPRL